MKKRGKKQISKLWKDYNIEFREACSDDDKTYVNMCVDSADFKEYITEDTGGLSFKIIERNGIRIGICSFLIRNRGELKIGEPVVYISQKKSIGSFCAICSTIDYLFSKEYVDRIEIKVLDNNTSMLALMEKSNFIQEGHINFIKKIGNDYIGMFYYSMLREEYT